MSLVEARQASLSSRKLLKEGVDPIEERARARQARQLHQARSVTFEICAEAYIEAHAPGWRNAKHAEQWRSTLKTYAFPIFGALPVQDIETPLVMKVLDPIWHTKTEWYSYELDSSFEGPCLLSFGRVHREGFSVWAL